VEFVSEVLYCIVKKSGVLCHCTQTPELLRWGHWPLHKMNITPNIIMICFDIQGEEHHYLEEHTRAMISSIFRGFLPRQK
jgi:hypothetical protein